MSFHIEAKPGDIAEIVLLPGDPRRAKYIAETYLEDAFCYNQVRNIWGYTGMYKGKRISVQGTGMGMPSMSIYATELVNEYGAKYVMRVGSSGSLHPDVKKNGYRARYGRLHKFQSVLTYFPPVFLCTAS